MNDTTDRTFGQDVIQQQGLVLVDFWAEWCGPCHMVAPVLEQLSKSFVGNARIVKLNVDDNPNTQKLFNVRSIPSVLFFRSGRHVDTVVGAQPKSVYEEKIRQYVA